MSNTLPATQRAWIVERKGSPAKALSLRSNWDVPTKLKPGQVLVKVQAAALNPVGYKLMKALPNFAGTGRPLPAEQDLAGVIVNGNDTSFSSGDQVFGFIPVEVSRVIRQGALAQYVRMPADHLVIRPPNVSPTQAAGITLVAETAYEGLIDIGKLESGQTILINGASSAVGAYAVQIAKVRGAKVVATASAKNEAFVRRMGADEFVDYTKEPIHEYFTANPPTPKFHLILDAVGLTDTALYTSSEAYLAPNGLFLSTGPLPANSSFPELWKMVKLAFTCYLHLRWLGGTKRSYKVFLLKHRKERLDAIQQMVTDGEIVTPVDSTYEFDDVLRAYDRLMSSRATGKIVIKVDPTVD